MIIKRVSTNVPKELLAALLSSGKAMCPGLPVERWEGKRTGINDGGLHPIKAANEDTSTPAFMEDGTVGEGIAVYRCTCCSKRRRFTDSISTPTGFLTNMVRNSMWNDERDNRKGGNITVDYLKSLLEAADYRYISYCFVVRSCCRHRSYEQTLVYSGGRCVFSNLKVTDTPGPRQVSPERRDDYLAHTIGNVFPVLWEFNHAAGWTPKLFRQLVSESVEAHAAYKNAPLRDW